MKRVLSSVITVVISFCLVAGFTPASIAKAENIKVGAILAVTGGASFLGGPEARTLEMMVEEINAKGGINGNKIDLIIKDSGANPEKAISFAKQLIEEDKVFAIIGPSTSGETMKIKNIAEEAEMILISCAAAEVIVNPVAKWVFKTPQKDSDAVKKIYGTMKDMGISKIAVLTGNTGFGNAGKGQLEAIAPEFGIEILASEVYDKKETDLSAVVAKLMANKDIQAVVNWSIVPAQGILAKNMRQAGWDVPLFQSHGFGNIKYVEAGGAAAEGIIFPAGRLLVAEDLPDSHPQKALLIKYKNDYEIRCLGEECSTFGGHAFDALTILVAGIKKAGVVDKEKVRDAIENLQGVAGTAGVFNFSPEDHNGLDINSFEMLTVKDGKFAIYNK
ncbi:MAG: ABC transporter substrate-binding protein [Desulfobulbaceae bacterium]|jgi:branched-chain amino acid transport system substrate-binding protein|nr:ABC transporter substrate-binding protein [Desulfobulbaceae bacterium]MDH3782443.1 ABC transporter substrate-binding protein [Desulfobulbaceae bacterium]